MSTPHDEMVRRIASARMSAVSPDTRARVSRISQNMDELRDLVARIGSRVSEMERYVRSPSWDDRTLLPDIVPLRNDIRDLKTLGSALWAWADDLPLE